MMKMGDPKENEGWKAATVHGADKARTRDLAGDGVERVLERVRVLDLANTLAAAALAGLDHDGVANSIGAGKTFFDGCDTGSLVGIIGDCDIAFR